MNENRDTQKTSSNTERSESEQGLGSSSNGATKPSEVRTIKVKKGIWRTYDATDGLPGKPRRLLQDEHGYLWIGTDVGLYRYDGMEFITYTTTDGLTDNQVWVLCEDKQGRLWIGTSGGVSCFDGKSFVTYTATNGLADDRVKALCADGQGRLWIGTQNGLSCFDGKEFINYTTADGLADNNVIALCADSQEKLWIGADGSLCCFDGKQFKTYNTADGIPERLWALCADSQGRIWITSGSSGEGVSCFDGQQFKTYTYDDGLVDTQNIVFGVCEDHQGRMWFGTWAGVSCFDGSRFINYRAADGLWADGVFDIIEDREGQIWLAHDQLCGLSCFDVETISLLTDQPATWVSTQDKKGRIWFSMAKNAYGICLDPESSEVQQRRLSFGGGVIWLMADSGGRLWIGAFRDGTYRYDSTDAAWESAGGKKLPEPRHFGVPRNVPILLEAKDGTIWFGFWKPDRISRFDPELFIDGAPLESVETKGGHLRLIEGSQGKLWMGENQGDRGLSCWDGNKLVIYTQEDGLPDDNVSSLVEDDAGRIWIGTPHGLCCFDGKRFITYGEERGLRDLYHWWAVKDTSGQLWFATHGGIYRHDGEHFQWLTEDDGLPSNNVTGILPQSDGSMIICTTGGIVHYQPTATVPPRVEIREVVADKVYQNPKELELTTTDADLLTISYHGLSLATRRMRYSYILEGYDEEWKETWDNQARYESLPMGEYTFKVIAINRDLVTSETPATLRLKVIPDPRDIRLTIIQSELNHLRREVGARYDFQDIIGQSDAIKEVQMRMERAIESDLNVVVLITGETGTGKELVANAIHSNGPRKDRPKVPYNCAAIPRELANSTLFGHRKGAFTGADEDRIGLFEAAEGGTLILDEIGDMPFDVQSVLLRVLEDRKFSRIGEFALHDVDVRIIAITNRNLDKEAEEGRFRRDLYYRLNEFPIHIPPLRERLEDIPILADHFLQGYLDESGREIDGFAPGVIELLESYPWPGNVRELEHAIQEAANSAIYEGTPIIQIYHFLSRITRGKPEMQDIISERLSYRESLDLFRRRLVEDALRESKGNRAAAARMLRMHRPNLVAVIKNLGIEIDKT